MSKKRKLSTSSRKLNQKKYKSPSLMNEIDLDEEEQEIENLFEKSEKYTATKVKADIAIAKKAAENFMKKDKRITIRIYSADLERIKLLAIEEGLPYQTFITSVLHKLSTGRLGFINPRPM